jgi:hypothetical protein
MAVIWEWNGEDTTQFAASADHVSGNGGPTPALTVEADSALPGGGYLQLTCTGTGTGAVVWLAIDPIDPDTYPVIDIEMEVEQLTAAYGGISFLAGDALSADFHAYLLTDGAAGWFGRIDADALEGEGGSQITSTLALTARGIVRKRIVMEKVAETEPKFVAYSEGTVAAGADARSVRSHDDYGDRPVPSTWEDAACDRWGLALQAGGGSAFGSLRIHRLRVIDPLADGSGDVTDPIVTFLLASETVIARTASITVDVTDESALRKVVVLAWFEALGRYEVPWDGSQFEPRYTASTRTAIAGGHRYVLTRSGGWPAAPTVRVVAIDTGGNEAVP